MLAALTDTLTRLIKESAALAPLAALVGGLMTAANPCVIAAIPLMIGFVAGQSEHRSALRSFLLSLTFCIGLTTTFMALFLATWAASSVLRASWWVYVAAAVCLLMGLQLLKVLDFRIPAPKGATPARKGFVGALLLGLLFVLVSMPCAGPILLVLLSIVPVKGGAYGSLLLIAYSLGHCALILVGGTSMGIAQRVIESKGLQGANVWLKRVAGVLIIIVGVYLLLAY